MLPSVKRTTLESFDYCYNRFSSRINNLDSFSHHIWEYYSGLFFLFSVKLRYSCYIAEISWISIKFFRNGTWFDQNDNSKMCYIMHLNENKNFSLVRFESTLSMYVYCTHDQIWILPEIHLIYKQRRDAPIKRLQAKHAGHNDTTKIKRQKVVETVVEEEYFNSKNSDFLVQNSNFQKIPLEMV